MAAVVSTNGFRSGLPYFGRPRRTFSTNASRRFFYLVDAIGKLHEPTKTQLESLESAYNSTARYVAACDEFKGLLVEVHPQGSRQLGTLLRPNEVWRDGFDVDLVIRFNQQTFRFYGDPAKLLYDLKRVLQRYADAHSLKLQSWERCVTLEYAGGMTADFAPVIDQPSIVGLYGDTLGRIPDRKLQLYDVTNPRGYAKAFNVAAAIAPNFSSSFALDSVSNEEFRASVAPLADADEVFDRLLCRLVQLLKLHRNVSFGVSSSAGAEPTSVFLTTLAAKAYTDLAPQLHASPLDLMLDIIEQLPRYFDVVHGQGGQEYWVLDNPSAPGDNLASGMNSPVRQQAFRQWHRRAYDDVEAILDAIDGRLGMDVVLKRVETAFGEKAAGAIRNQEVQERQSQRSVGRVMAVGGAGAFAMPARSNTNFGD
jgi:hypothetical protein